MIMQRLLFLLLLLCSGAFAGDDPHQPEQLFQPIPADYTPGTLPRVPPFLWKDIGATATHVARHTGWAWRKKNGDWIDRTGTLHGPDAWVTFNANAVTGTTTAHRYELDVTAAVIYIEQNKRWNAWHLRELQGNRKIAGVRHLAAPVINVVYEDGTAEALDGLYSADMTSSTVYSVSYKPTHDLPAVLEFERPRKPVARATLLLTVLGHPTGRVPIAGNIIDPPLNKNPVEYGLAARYGPLDAGVETDPAVIGVHRYIDGSKREDFISSERMVITSTRFYSPHIWGYGPENRELLPFKDNGKWIAASQFELVDSSRTDDSFKALAPNLGAIKIEMPAMPGIKDGSVVGSAGTRASTGKIFMPPEHFGKLDRIFVRYYWMSMPVEDTFAKRYQVYNNPDGPGSWLDQGGKIGIAPAHDTWWGGVSGTSGGPYGWQLRFSWYRLNRDKVGNPGGGKQVWGVHTYDYMRNAPVGHKYGGGSKPHMLDEQGGGMALMESGRWYCIEMEVDLNTITQIPPYYLPDGAVRVWVDGRLALEMDNFVMRTGPKFSPPYHEQRLPPAYEVGIRDLWLNWFHGGKTENGERRVDYYTGLVWAHEYIGPMKFQTNVSAANDPEYEPQYQKAANQ